MVEVVVMEYPPSAHPRASLVASSPPATSIPLPAPSDPAATTTAPAPKENITNTAAPSSPASDETKTAAPRSPRRSARATKSTITYINGHAVKKSNNYQLKGHTYAFGPVGTDQPLQKKRATKPSSPTTVKKKPRIMTNQEVTRKKMKESVEQRITAKRATRISFFQEHVSALRPFVDSKILQQIHRKKGPGGSKKAPTHVYAQPAAIQTAILRDYQLEGLNWMYGMYQRNVGMILGDEMGLGKTLQTIALICHIHQNDKSISGPSLVVCPLSVLYSWCSEVEKWAPSFKCLRFHNSNTESLDTNQFNNYDIIITTYEMTRSSSLKNLWARQCFNLLVLDEGHRIKNFEADVSQAVRRVHCELRVILTGTPLANNLAELYSLLNFLCPDVFTIVEPFAAAFDLALNIVDPEKLQMAHTLLQVFMLRRLKGQVEKLMPKKVETKIVCPLSSMQMWWYKAMLLKDIGLLTSGETKTKSKLLNNLIMQLRKVSIHPFLFPGAEDEDTSKTTLTELIGASGKLAVLDKLLRSLYDKKDGHRVVLFSQFTSVLDILDDYCSQRGWKYCRFDGSTQRAQRNYMIQSFNRPGSDTFLFLMSTRAGGLGINLQTADTCILFDSDWNPQPDIQAMARVHRLGQTKTVHVYRLVTKGTVEQRMVERAEKKLYLDCMVTRDGATDAAAVTNEIDPGKDTSTLLSTLRFGCNAVFGSEKDEMLLPSDEDIAIITDRNRSEDYSKGNLKGDAVSNAENFDATAAFTSTTQFGGIDFKAIREQHKKDKDINSVREISAQWAKRKKKQRIKMVHAKNTGWGGPVPVLNANDYDLQSGELSVFDRELAHQQRVTKVKKKTEFEWQDFCQNCGDGGLMVQCPACPISMCLTEACAGVRHAKHFHSCSHHRCSVCHKTAGNAGGLLLPCSYCSHAYCEDHLPNEAIVLEDGCERMGALGQEFPRHGWYVICSPTCENVATTEFGWKRPPANKPKAPCPPPLDVDGYFGGQVTATVEVPEESKRSQRQATDVDEDEGSKPSPRAAAPLRSIHPRKSLPAKAPVLTDGGGRSSRISLPPATPTMAINFAQANQGDIIDLTDEKCNHEP